VSLLSKLERLAERSRQLAEHGVNPFGVQQDSIISATEAVVEGRPTILAGTNNYLGLTFDESCIAAAREALEHEGTGTTGSRMANGTFAGHVALEQELAEFFERRHCTVFSTGYLANLGVLAALTGRDDVIVIDADSHASIYDGCELSGAEIIRFRHNDPADLDKRLRRLGERNANTLVVVEGIYSMLGDRAPLREIVEIKNHHGSYLMVDEAHSLGVLGETGRGLAQEVGVEDDVDFVVGTFSKSLGGVGGFCVSDHEELEMVRFVSRPYIFTASPPPSVVATTRAALEALRTGPELRERLWRNARQMYDRLEELGYRLGPDVGPVIAASLDTPDQALGFWRSLVERGIYVNLMLPPATPGGRSLVRCSVSAAHTTEQIERICEAFEELKDARL